MKKVVIRIGLLQVPMLLASVMSYGQKKDSLKTSSIDEVVVTAYGIKKEKKALGYVYQDIKGADVVEAREVNVTDAMVGKVSGLQLVKSSTGPAGSSKIILRGFNSLTGDNQPLIVVDGVPMSNFIGSTNNDFWNAEPDMGNGLSDLNPEDIENVTVLKSGAASALYGSRAGNGVIMITTKKGKKNKGAGILYSNTLNIETMFVYPKVQREFSQGSNGDYIASAEGSGLSWGEKINGQTVTRWDGKKESLRAYDNLNTFFRPGITNNNTITFQQAVGENTTVFSSVGYWNSSAMIPNSKYDRLNATARVTTKFGANNRWSSDIKIQYINSFAENRPVGGHDTSYYGQVLTLPTTLNLADFKEGMDQLGAIARWYTPAGSKQNNPYWYVYNRLNSDARNRFMMNANLRYEFSDWLNVNVKVGSDMYNTKTEGKTYTGGPTDNFYSTGQNRFIENNYIASLNLKRDNLFGKWSGAFSVFGQIMTSTTNSNSMSGILDVPNYFSVKNFLSYTADRMNEGRSKQQINSAFATLDIDYDGFWFINATARNDWSSTMSKANRSYFYPSVSTSLVITDMFKKLWDNSTHFGKVITFAKIRGSYAVTGNSLKPYELYNTYLIGHDPLGNLTVSGGRILYNENVQSELLKTYEFGLNLRFFNRVDLDVNYYNTHATRQLIKLPMNPLSGYAFRMINAGDIQNKGIEVILNADLIRKAVFKWNLSTNFSKNTNKVLDLTDGIDFYPLSGFDNLSVGAYTGQRYGVIYGTKYARVEDPNSQYYGKKILNGKGLPTTDSKQYILGDQTPRALVGITNRFNYKNLSLSFQIDGRFGGKFYSGTMNTLKGTGLANETVVNGLRDKFIVDGVIADGNGGYKQNTMEVTPQNYWNTVSNSGNLGINEENVFDATNMRLRNVQISYSLPKGLFKNSPFQSAKFSFSVNNVWMIYSKVKGVDPEASYALSSNATGFEYLSYPTSRSYVFNLTVGF